MPRRKAQGALSEEEENTVSCFKSKHGITSVAKLLNNISQEIKKFKKILNSQKYSLRSLILHYFIY